MFTDPQISQAWEELKEKLKASHLTAKQIAALEKNFKISASAVQSVNEFKQKLVESKKVTEETADSIAKFDFIFTTAGTAGGGYLKSLIRAYSGIKNVINLVTDTANIVTNTFYGFSIPKITGLSGLVSKFTSDIKKYYDLAKEMEMVGYKVGVGIRDLGFSMDDVEKNANKLIDELGVNEKEAYNIMTIFAKLGPMTKEQYSGVMDQMVYFSKAFGINMVESGEIARKAYQSYLTDLPDIGKRLTNMALLATDLRVEFNVFALDAIGLSEKYRLFGTTVEEAGQMLKDFQQDLGLTHKEANNLIPQTIEGLRNIAPGMKIYLMEKTPRIFGNTLASMTGLDLSDYFSRIGAFDIAMTTDVDSLLSMMWTSFDEAIRRLPGLNPRENLSQSAIKQIAVGLTEAKDMLGPMFPQLPDQVIIQLATAYFSHHGELNESVRNTLRSSVGKLIEDNRVSIADMTRTFKEAVQGRTKVEEAYANTINKFNTEASHLRQHMASALEHVGDVLAKNLKGIVEKMADFTIKMDKLVGELMNWLLENEKAMKTIMAIVAGGFVLEIVFRVSSLVSRIVNAMKTIKDFFGIGQKAVETVEGTTVGISALPLLGLSTIFTAVALGTAYTAGRIIVGEEEYQKQVKLRGSPYEASMHLMASIGLGIMEGLKSGKSQEQYEREAQQLIATGGFASGGLVNITGLYQLERGEYVLTEQERRNMAYLLGEQLRHGAIETEKVGTYKTDFEKHKGNFWEFVDLHNVLKNTVFEFLTSVYGKLEELGKIIGNMASGLTSGANMVATGGIDYTGNVPGNQPEGVKDIIRASVNKWSRVMGIDPALVMAVIKAESEGNPQEISSKGALGLMQVMPSTFAAAGVTATTKEQMMDIDTNIRAGVSYLSQQLKAFGGDLSKAIAAYNAGPARVREYGGIPPFKETQNYVEKVMRYYNEYKGSRVSLVGGSPVKAILDEPLIIKRESQGMIRFEDSKGPSGYMEIPEGTKINVTFNNVQVISEYDLGFLTESVKKAVNNAFNKVKMDYRNAFA